MGRPLLAAFAFLSLAAPALAAEGPRWCASAVGLLPPAEGGAKDETARPVPVPMRRTSAAWDLDVRGAVATGTLTELFESPTHVAVEAQYRFLPGPGMEVRGLRVEVDGREIELEAKAPPKVATRGRARRPVPGSEWSDSFVVPAGSVVQVTTEVQAALGFRAGWFALELPAVSSACGRSPARRGSRPEAEPALLEASLRIHHSGVLKELESDTHELVSWEESGQRLVSLEAGARAADGPLRVRYRLGQESEEEPGVSAWISEPDEEDTRDVLIVLTPPEQAPRERVAATDVVFVLDTSGSMKGAKLSAARTGLSAALRLLDGEDLFDVLRFSADSEAWSDGLKSATAAEQGNARDWLESRLAEGTTQLESALRRAIGLAGSGAGHPLVVVLTDGAIHDADAVEKALRADGGRARVLFVGIGEAPQQDVLRRLAAVARGDAAFAREPSQVVDAVKELFTSFAAPLAWDLSLEAPGAAVVSTWPERLPDLYEGRPVSVFLRVRGALPSELRLHGTTVAGAFGLDRSLVTAELPEAPGLRGPRERPRERRGR